MTTPTSDSSFDLVHAAKGGDGTALGELIRRHLPTLRAYIRAHCGAALRQREPESDLVQSVCGEVLGDLDRFEWRGEGSFRHWLCTVALHKLRNKADFHGAQRRNPGREVRRDATDAESLADIYATICSPSQHAIAGEFMTQFEAAMDRIPEQYRDVIWRSRVFGFSHREIAEQLDRSEGAVRVLLNRALARLAGVMHLIEQESRGG